MRDGDKRSYVKKWWGDIKNNSELRIVGFKDKDGIIGSQIKKWRIMGLKEKDGRIGSHIKN